MKTSSRGHPFGNGASETHGPAFSGIVSPDSMPLDGELMNSSASFREEDEDDLRRIQSSDRDPIKVEPMASAVSLLWYISFTIGKLKNSKFPHFQN